MAKTFSKTRLQNLQRRFGPMIALNNSDLKIYNGTSVIVIGGSSRGILVMGKYLLVDFAPKYGSITIDCCETIDVSSDERTRINFKFGILLQGTDLFDRQSEWKKLASGLIAQNNIRVETRNGTVCKPTQTGLELDILGQYLMGLSCGMKKRMGLASAIATDPEIIYFYELTSGLDTMVGDIIIDLIVRPIPETSAMAFTSTDITQSAREIANRIAMIIQNIIIWNASTDQINDNGSGHVDQFIHVQPDCPIQMALPN